MTEIVSRFKHAPPLEADESSLLTDSPAVGAKSSQRTDTIRDSGYNTDEALTQVSEYHSQEQIQDTSHVYKPPLRSVPVTLGGKEFFRFKKDPDHSTQGRYAYITEEIQTLLIAEMKKRRVRFGSISFKSWLLGSTEKDAREYIVVLCPDHLVRLVENLFKSETVRQLCKPYDYGDTSFEYVVDGRPPQLSAMFSDIWVFGIPMPSELEKNTGFNFCGRPVRLWSPAGQVKESTCGGIIKVVGHDNEATLYGMTVGHGVLDLENYTSRSGPPPAAVENEDPSPTAVMFAGRTQSDEAAKAAELFDAKRNWRALGTIQKAQAFAPDEKQDQYFDWALFELNRWIIRPNKYISKVSSIDPKEVVSYDIGTEVGRFPPGTSRQRVEVVRRGQNPSTRGDLSNVPARIMLGPGEVFSEAYILTLDDGEPDEVRIGDSGSWVVESSTGNVFGHIVAVDVFKDAYVIPFDGTLRDIQKRFGAKSVQLPSMADIEKANNDYLLSTADGVRDGSDSQQSSCHGPDSGYSTMTHTQNHWRDGEIPRSGQTAVASVSTAAPEPPASLSELMFFSRAERLQLLSDRLHGSRDRAQQRPRDFGYRPAAQADSQNSQLSPSQDPVPEHPSAGPKPKARKASDVDGNDTVDESLGFGAAAGSGKRPVKRSRLGDK